MTSRSSLTLVADNKTSEKLIQSLSEAFPKQEPSLKRIQESSPIGINIELSPKVQGHSRPRKLLQKMGESVCNALWDYSR